MSIDPETKREIIIVRRGGHDDHDSHHGGVWKIAYADFMTAMMAFFLVMWLINAANEETKAAVASYFNPVKLIDRHSSSKGVQDVEEKDGKVRYESDQKIENSTKVINDTTVAPPSDGKSASFSANPMRSSRNWLMKPVFCRTSRPRAMAVPRNPVRQRVPKAVKPIAIRSARITGRAKLSKT